MKNAISLLTGLLLICSISSCKRNEARDNSSKENTIAIYSAPELKSLTSEWASEYCRLNPDIKITVRDYMGKGFDENRDIGSNLCFISGENDILAYNSSTFWKVIVGRDVIVPVINAANPYKDEILRRGITREELARIFVDPEVRNWGSLLKTQQNDPVNIYLLNDATTKSLVADLMNIRRMPVNGVNLENRGKIISKVLNDPYSLGICKIADILDLKNQGNPDNAGLLFLPIDKNSNGQIDYMEEIYDDPEVLARGVWIGKYPRTFFNNIYSVSSVKPTNKNEVAFLKWVLTGGQQYLNSYGFSNLLLNERQAKIDFLDDYKINLASSEEHYTAGKSTLFFLASIIAVAFIGFSILRRAKNRKGFIKNKASHEDQVFDENYVDIQLGLYYAKTHTWAYMEKDGLVKIGIDDFLQHITGPLTRIKMTDIGKRVIKGRQVLSIVQNGKQLNIYSPVSGTIIEQNKILLEDSSIINSSPYSDGWIYKIDPSKWSSEIRFLIMGNKYKEWIKSEFSRLKEFLTSALKSEVVSISPVLQDGGELKDGILTDLGPEVWEDFQTHFIDEYR